MEVSVEMSMVSESQLGGKIHPQYGYARQATLCPDSTAHLYNFLERHCLTAEPEETDYHYSLASK